MRNAFLFQYIDYRERSPHGPISRRKLAGIKEYFPELKHSRSVEGTIISKNTYTWDESYDTADMGRILGFPCRYEFDYILEHPEKPSVTIEIIVHLTPGGDEDDFQIMVYRCKDLSHYQKAVKFAKEAQTVLKKDHLVGQIIKSVEAKKTIHLGRQTKRLRKHNTTPNRTKSKPFRKHTKTPRRS